MDPRASALIETLALVPHAEGGFFREVFRSAALVTTAASGTPRSAVTSIYYLLPAGQVSRFHRITSDEIWHFLEGDPLELHTLDPSSLSLRTVLLGPVSGSTVPIHVVPANHWQAALPGGAFTLASCTVGPGFEYDDFVLLAEDAILRTTVRERFPGLAALL
jgi:predicted cupin superfamily sugar epimerase